MGHPKQEMFMIRNQKDLNVKTVIGCGGFFDFVSGTKPRAPKKVRDWGFEWVFRLAIEPRRMFRRYVIGNPVFLIRCLWYLRRDLKLMRASDQTKSIRSNATSETVAD
jgi:N-acetylglucosaminyldiphosphoundecaprenol N-acetyl-beta-D-mannosaminyltransferase